MAESSKVSILPFREARVLARTLKLRTQTDWRSICATGERPPGIPYKPDEYYKGSGWCGWPDFLGRELRHFLPFDEIHSLVMSKRLDNSSEYKRWHASLPKEERGVIPLTPERVYKNSGWKGWHHFLTGEASRKFVDYEACMKFARSKKITSRNDWLRMCDRGERPKHIPSDPVIQYKNSGWKGWPEFLGNKNSTRRGRGISFANTARI